MDAELEFGRRGRRLTLSASFENAADGAGNNAAVFAMSYTEIFETVCPEYMAMGMPYDEFWNGDPWAVRMYRKAYRRRREQHNENAWMNGVYMMNAIAACFSGKKKKNLYPQKPIDFFGNDNAFVIDTELDEADADEYETPEEKKRRIDDMRFNAYMTAMMSDVNKRFKEQKEVPSGKEAGKDGG